MKHCLLVVEDSDDDVMMLKRAFAAVCRNFEPRFVPDADQALKYLAGEAPFADRGWHPMPCMLLLDLRLPGASGFDLLRCLKGEPKLMTVPVVVLTVSDRQEDIARAYALGASSYLVKPAGPNGYVSLVETFDQYWVLNTFPPVLASLPEFVGIHLLGQVEGGRTGERG